MKTTMDVIRLLAVGATGRARALLKRLAVPVRMRVLNSFVPQLQDNKEYLDFFRRHFSAEIGALSHAGWDPIAAARLWQAAASLRSKRSSRR